MKKLYTFIAVGLLGIATAQVPNNGFEQTLEDGFTLRSWGTFFPTTISVGLDGAEVVENTNIVFDNGFGFSMPVGDCLTGNWAMQISNAFDTANEVVIPGRASLFNEEIATTATGWNNGVPLQDGTVVEIFGFDYKFFPMGNDIASARLEIFNDDGESIGVAEIVLAETVSEFQYIYVPVSFTQANQTPKFMTIDFSMQKGGSQVNSWSTLIVDNVVVNWSMLGVRQQENKPFAVYPTMVDNAINIIGNTAGADARVSIVNLEGKKLQQQAFIFDQAAKAFDVTDLASGVYFVEIETTGHRATTRFIKK